jgi:hypothetical protein
LKLHPKVSQAQGEKRMKVSIKSFAVDMDVKTKGIEFDVYENGEDGAHLGDCIITRTGITWCEGRKRRANGTFVRWQDFIDWMNAPTE